MARAHNGDVLVNRALASRSRLQLLRLLRKGDGLGVEELASRVGLHPSTVRRHVELLAEVGLLRRRTERTGGRGRPRVVYQAAIDDDGREDGYQLLAAILAEQVRDGPDAASAAGERAGRPWGGRLVTRRPGRGRVGVREAHERVVALFAELGFAPELATGGGEGAGGARMLLRRCPFLALAKTHPELVCGIHLGLLRGALEALEAPVQAVGLEPFVRPDLCVAHLRSQGR